MPEGAEPSVDEPLAPVDVIVVEFPDGTPSPGGFAELLRLAEARVVQVLDLEFVAKDASGVRVVTAADLPHVEGLDPTVWEGSSSGLLDQDDLALVGESIAEGSLAVVVVFENLWVLDLVGRWTASGGRMILDGAVPVEALLDALDATEPR